MLHCLSQEISFIICYYWHTSAVFPPFGTSSRFCSFGKCFSRNSWGMIVASACKFSCVFIHSLSSLSWLCWVAVSKAGMSFQTTSMADEEHRGKERGSNCRGNTPVPYEPGSFEIWERVQRGRIGRRPVGNCDLTWTAHGKLNGDFSPGPHCYRNAFSPPSSPFCMCI